MICDNDQCQSGEITHGRPRWVNKDYLRVEYYCSDHAPADAELIVEGDEDEQ